MPARRKSGRTESPQFEYVTSTVSLLQGDGIVVHALNDSSINQSTHVIIYQNTGAGAVTVADSGTVLVVPTWQWGLGFTVPNDGEYWLRIRVSSESLIPKASFERFVNSTWVPVVSYRPGDFAMFELRPKRKRIW